MGGSVGWGVAPRAGGWVGGVAPPGRTWCGGRAPVGMENGVNGTESSIVTKKPSRSVSSRYCRRRLLSLAGAVQPHQPWTDRIAVLISASGVVGQGAQVHPCSRLNAMVMALQHPISVALPESMLGAVACRVGFTRMGRYPTSTPCHKPGEPAYYLCWTTAWAAPRRW